MQSGAVISRAARRLGIRNTPDRDLAEGRRELSRGLSLFVGLILLLRAPIEMSGIDALDRIVAVAAFVARLQLDAVPPSIEIAVRRERERKPIGAHMLRSASADLESPAAAAAPAALIPLERPAGIGTAGLVDERPEAIPERSRSADDAERPLEAATLD
jgi:hypothetical protein